ncbi:MAG: hypothetical protein HQK64_08225, partial [Desulfamplus sp.]|nr:hypothetical protein [Desulfamplus sp.]
TSPPDHTIYYNIKPCSGAECNPYTPEGEGYAPIIASYQNGGLTAWPQDLAIDFDDGAKIIRLESYDPDGDTVTLAAESSSDKLQVSIAGNMLTITPSEANVFSNITIKAQSADGTKDKSFKVLVLGEMIYSGTSYNINGQFANGQE